MKQDCLQAPVASKKRLVVGTQPPEPDSEHSPSFGPLWSGINTASELVVGYSVVGCLGYASVLALGTALALGARLVFPAHALPASAGAVVALGIGLIALMRWSGKRLIRSAGRAELTPRGVRFAKPAGDRKRIPWDYVQGYTAHPRWIQLQIGDRQRPQHAIPTPNAEERSAVLAFLDTQGIRARA